MGMSYTCVLLHATPSFQGCMPCIFVICGVTSTCMQTRARNVSDFRDSIFSKSLSAVILLPCKLDATERSIHSFEMFSKDVL